ncbi:Hsp20/alpha crystallin family protein [Fictibacillus sp. Mic-4]|uniref:Hsp20/alpha crystallin family protein n=1 Tax=Fictibacillus TaxID=1329200 RepID=UPI0003FF53F0|nr:Hsp20/alpha crystallin family protein [Fictibacillus gelatini]
MDHWKKMMEWKQYADQYLGQSFFAPITQEKRTTNNPPVNVYESDKEILCVFRLPGVEGPDDVEIYVDIHSIKVKGSTHVKKGKYRPVNEEFATGSFEREVELPFRVKSEPVQAFYKKGFLYIRLQRVQDKQRMKKVDIKRFED